MTRKLSFLLVLCLSLVVAASSQEQEQRIRMKDLPPAVHKTATEQSRGARIRGVSKEIEDGQTFYEISLIVRGLGREVLIDSEGNVAEIEDVVTLASLPSAVRAEIKKQKGRGRILKIESIKKNNAIVAYEALIRLQKKLKEVKVSPDGKVMPEG
ncbi:MAG: hypothetical protein AB1631_12975 [Acidobacteriota bacterium]